MHSGTTCHILQDKKSTLIYVFFDSEFALSPDVARLVWVSYLGWFNVYNF